MNDGGYPLDWFAESIDEILKCGICGQVLRDPRTTKCGHVYCSQCLYSWVAVHGKCPQECAVVMIEEVGQLKRMLQIEKLISGLLTHCKFGCPTKIELSRKQQHEKTCTHSKLSSGFLLPLRLGGSQETVAQVQSTAGGVIYHKRTNSSEGFFAASKPRIRALAKRSPSSAAILCRVPHDRAVAMTSKATFSTHTFKLRRSRTKEPLGLVLVSGEKTLDGRPKSFYVKKVHPDTLGWKAGLQARDRIVQVDHHDLVSIDPKEAVARIKEKAQVTLTVHRRLNSSQQQHKQHQQGLEDHVYDEIIYTDQNSQNLSQSQDDNPPTFIGMSSLPRRCGSSMAEETSRRHQPRPATALPPNSAHLMPPLLIHGGRVSRHGAKSPQLGLEQGSKDSGLSSGSSTHQEPEERHTFAEGYPFSPLGDAQRSSSSVGWEVDQHCRLEGEYEVEDIYLQKNGTSQLGITLGYNTKTASGQLYVCEIVPGGLAEQNGKLQVGDIIKRVNGFEVHDPEEAILLFLEQDQDITLTVARPVKALPSHSRATSRPITGPSHHQYHYPEGQQEGAHAYATLDSTSTVRRVDSYGSLETHSHLQQQQQQDSSRNRCHSHHDNSGTSSTGELMRRTKSAGSAMRNRDHHHNRQSPPARQPSPLVLESQQPLYHVLQQPSSPEQPVTHHRLTVPEQQPLYHTLQQPDSPLQPNIQQLKITEEQPLYHVLQQPNSPPQGQPDNTTTQQPLYHILQQPNSPQGQLDNATTPQPLYHVLQQPNSPQGQPDNATTQQPLYHVLQQPNSPQGQPDNATTQQPLYHVLQQQTNLPLQELKRSSGSESRLGRKQEDFRPRRNSGSDTTSNRRKSSEQLLGRQHHYGSTQSLQRRPLPHHSKHKIADSSSLVTPAPPCSRPPPSNGFRPITAELGPRCATVPVEYLYSKTESLV